VVRQIKYGIPSTSGIHIYFVSLPLFGLSPVKETYTKKNLATSSLKHIPILTKLFVKDFFFIVMYPTFCQKICWILRILNS